MQIYIQVLSIIMDCSILARQNNATAAPEVGLEHQSFETTKSYKAKEKSKKDFTCANYSFQ